MSGFNFIVTGCSRSGTGYISELLSAIGFECGHERIFNIHRVLDLEKLSDNFVDFPKKHGDSSHLAVPFLKDLPNGTVVLHQVRHPVPVIRSHMGIRYFANPYQPSMYLADNHPDFLKFIARHCPDVFEDGDELKRCMRYWVLWNRLAQRAEQIDGLRYLRYKVESISRPLIRQIFTLLGSECNNDIIDNALSSVSRSTNTRLRDFSVSWETIPEGNTKETVKQLAIEYGYSLP